MNYPRYPRYRPSGVDWLGDVPEHWEVGRLKQSVIRSDRKVEADPGFARPYLGLEHVESWTGRLLLGGEEMPQPEGISNEFSAASVLFGKLRPYLAKAAAPGFAGICSSEFLVLEPDRLERRFLLLLLLSEGFISLVDSSTYGAKMPRASWEFIGSCPVVVPPPAEQRAISAFLDARTAKLDTLIEKKRSLIDKLQEKRAALISYTVTRGLPPDAAHAAGLDPNTELKPSGIEWLGDIPKNWSARRIKYLARVESGHTPSRSVDEYWTDCAIPWLSLNDSGYLRTHDLITDTAHRISQLGLANSSAHLLPEGAVVFSRDATVGLCAITSKPMAVSQHFIAYLCGADLVPGYLLLCLKSMGQHLERLSMGSTIPTIGMVDIYSLACPLPPVDEQCAITHYVETETTKVDGRIARVEIAIERLQEYRAALITAAVTGKIDVRRAVA